MKRILLIAAMMLPLPAFASGEAAHPKQHHWSFDGPLGRVDKQAAQRGFQVYKEVCAACHSLKHVAFRNLADLGFSEGEVKTIAAEYTVMDGPNDDGEMFERPGRPSDRFPSPYANEQAARASQNGAYPPDFSLITKARHDGPNYIYSLLTGYAEAPAYECTRLSDEGACVKFHRINGEAAAAKEEAKKAAIAEGAEPALTVGDVLRCASVTKSEEIGKDGKTSTIQTCAEIGKGLYYNPYFPNRQIAMPAPLTSEGQVSYQDETKASVSQMAADLVHFLQWAAEPEMQARKQMGMKVMIFLLVMTGFFFVAKKRIWKDIEH